MLSPPCTNAYHALVSVWNENGFILKWFHSLNKILPQNHPQVLLFCFKFFIIRQSYSIESIPQTIAWSCFLPTASLKFKANMVMNYPDEYCCMDDPRRNEAHQKKSFFRFKLCVLHMMCCSSWWNSSKNWNFWILNLEINLNFRFWEFVNHFLFIFSFFEPKSFFTDQDGASTERMKRLQPLYPWLVSLSRTNLLTTP